MNQLYTAVSTIHINASPEKVWEAITNSEKVKQYFFGSELVTTWEVESPITFKGEWQGVPYEDKGMVLIYNPRQKLSYEIPDKYGVVTYEVTAKNTQTQLTISQAGIATEEEHKQSEQNWSMVLTGIKRLLEA